MGAIGNVPWLAQALNIEASPITANDKDLFIFSPSAGAAAGAAKAQPLRTRGQSEVRLRRRQ